MGFVLNCLVIYCFIVLGCLERFLDVSTEVNCIVLGGSASFSGMLKEVVVLSSTVLDCVPVYAT